MKKQGRKIWLTITMALIMLISSFACFGISSNFDKSDVCVLSETFNDEKVSYSLVPANYYSDPDKQTKYNLGADNLDSFTPFDFETKTRMSGDAFKLTEGENQQIIDQFVKVDYHNDIDKNDALALVFWVYIDGTLLHNLSLTIEFENGATLSFNLSRSELENLLEKPGKSSSYPYAYNKFSLPLSAGIVEGGEIVDGDLLVAPTKITFNYLSNLTDEQKTKVFARLYFYDIRLETADNSTIAVTEKQDYFISSFNHMPAEIKDSVCIGDQYKIPTLSSVVNYAYKGKENLLVNNIHYSWRVRVAVPDKDDTITTISFNDTVTFELEGVYKIYYECVHSDDGKVQIDVYAVDMVEVNSFNAIYFSKSKAKVNVGTAHVINIETSALFTDVSDITFEYDENALDVTLGNNGEVSILAKKEGTFSVVAKVSGKRALSPSLNEYQCSLEVVARSVSENNMVYRIILYVILAGFGIAFLITLVILLVKSRKVVVK